MRPAKVRITDHRPPGAGGKRPLEAGGLTRGGSLPGLSGPDHLAAIRSREAAEHDRWVAGYGREMLAAAWDDLRGRPASDRKDPVQRWVMGRRAAIARAAQRMERNQK